MPKHHNDDAWNKAPLFGVLAYAVLLAVALPRADGERSDVAVWLLLPTVIATGLLVAVATHSRQRWTTRSWLVSAPVTAALVALGAGLVMQSSPVHDDGVPTAAPRTLDELRGGTGAGTGEATDTGIVPASDTVDADEPTPSTEPLVAKDTTDSWTRIQTPEVVAEDGQLARWTQDLYGVDGVAVGSYTNPAAGGVQFRFIGVNGHIDAASPEAAGRASLVSAAGTSVVPFPPDADGWLGCNSASAQGAERVSCAWVGEQRAVFLRFEPSSISMAQAAALTRSFRDFASS